MEAIKTSQLTKYYGKSRGILQLDLTVEKGEFFGFIGPNGAGKSTTIRTLLGLIAPSGGTAQILGMDIRRQQQEILQRTGYLPSEAAFYPGQRVEDAIKLSADLRRQDCGAEAASLCERLHLDPRQKVADLSFGNRKKLAIVCALQAKPDLLILDEPTGGLDPLMQQSFFQILKERNRAGATIFLSSHILSEVQRHCGRAAIIREGQIIACDSVEALARTNARRIHLEGEADLNGLDGIKDLIRREGSASFLYTGALSALLERLARGHIRDLSIAEPDLEEIFRHYYEKEEQP